MPPSSGLDGNMRTCRHEKNLNLADWGGPCKPGGTEIEWGTSASVLYWRKHARFRGNTSASLVAGKEVGLPVHADKTKTCSCRVNKITACRQTVHLQKMWQSSSFWE
jgi:hypothetical protein